MNCALRILLGCLFCMEATALEWQSALGYRWAELDVRHRGKTGFTLLSPAESGVTFSNALAAERSITNRALLSGSGVAVGDADGDGLCDLYFCSLLGNNALYRNLGGGKFALLTSPVLDCANQHSTAAAFADTDGDGDLDLLVNALGNGTRLFLNDGKGQFSEAPSAGVASRSGSMSMALADIDGDGDLDLYVANFRPSTMQDEPRVRYRIAHVDGQPVVTAVNDRPASDPDLTNRFVVSPGGRVLEFGEADALYLNDGKGRFAPASFTDGRFLDEDGKPLLLQDGDWGLAVQFYDFTGDGAPEIYVCNDLYTPDRIWINDGKGNFRAIDRTALRCTSTFSMGVDFGDLDRDGDIDFFVVDMLSREHQKRQVQVAEATPVFWPIGLNDHRSQVSRNTLQINRGDGTFMETAFFSGVEASEWSWGPIFMDVDLDGFEDILITNGQFRDYQNADIARRIEATRGQGELTRADMLRLLSLYPEYASPNVLFRNRGNLKFEEVGSAWGFGTVGISQGMALGDIDNDGDYDLIVNNLNAVASIYRNDSSAPRIAVRLKGVAPNTRGIGAKIKVIGGAVPEQAQEMICAGRYLSGDDPVRVFSAGSATNRLSIAVTWRSGRKSVVDGAHANRIYEIDESSALPAKQRESPAATPALFEDVSDRIKHVHYEEPFEDFEHQPLLPRRLSRLGPGVAWYDVDADGWDDLAIGGGRGGKLAVYRNDRQGGFAAMTNSMLSRPIPRDQTAVLGMGRALLAGASNYEDGKTNGGWLRVYDFQRLAAGDSVLGPTASTGPMALADIDGDGDLDLFVGGRAVPGRYPEPADSLLLRNEGGRLTLQQRLEKLGLVIGTVWSDLNGDGRPELILACEWSPIRVFALADAKLVERTEAFGLQNHKGWWHGVTTGDFDGDGRLDIVASNWGLNSPYQPTRESVCRLYYADFDGNDSVDIIQTRFDPQMRKEVPERGLRLLTAAMPLVGQRVKSFEDYGKSSVQEILADELKSAKHVDANTFATTVFFNRDARFEPVPLPSEAQLSPAQGVCVADMDGDGHEDIFLAQNFFPVNPETSRLDAGRGLLLKGDGKGGFAAVPGQQSGIQAYGEQRGCAVGDFDADGRVDLVTTQNGAATKLYRNAGAKPGLRVRLQGPPGNDYAIGASLRLKFSSRLGPVREIHGGSGYWSQDSVVQVMPTPESPTQLWVRWPGGRETTSDVPKEAREILVDGTGAVKKVR